MPFSTTQALNPDYSRPLRTRIYRFPRNNRPITLSDNIEETASPMCQLDEVNVPEGWSEADAYELYLSDNPSTDPEEQEYRNRRLSELRERDDGELRQFLRVATGSGDPSEIITRERENQMVALLHRARQEGREGTEYVSLLSDYINRHRLDNPTEDGLQRQLLSILRQHQMRSQINESSINIQRAMERQVLSGASGVFAPSVFTDEMREQSVNDWHGGLNSLLKRDKVKPVQNHYLFGLEFEAYKPDGTKLQFIKTQFGTDGSLAPPKNHSGFEFRMEPMKFDSAHQHVRRLLPYIRNKGCDVNASCGFHTHISHDIFFDSKFIKKLVFFWISIEDVIMSTQPDSRSNNFYCKRTLFQYIKDVGKNLPSAKDDLIYAMGDTDRYSALNLTALQKHGTIEIRLHAGTLDEEKIINWTILLKAIFDYVKDAYQPQTAHSIFRQEISDEKIARVFKLLKLPEETAKFYTERIQKFGWERLKEQTKLAKECIIIQKEKVATEKALEKVQKNLDEKVKKIRGEIRQYRGGRDGIGETVPATPSRDRRGGTVNFRRYGDPFPEQLFYDPGQTAMTTIGTSLNFASTLRTATGSINNGDYVLNQFGNGGGRINAGSGGGESGGTSLVYNRQSERWGNADFTQVGSGLIENTPVTHVSPSPDAYFNQTSTTNMSPLTQEAVERDVNELRARDHLTTGAEMPFRGPRLTGIGA